MKNLIKYLILILVIVSCKKDPEVPESKYVMGGGVLILNEGNFMGGNGSLSFYSYDSSKIYNDLFTTINGRPLGDVPNSIVIKSDRAYIVVNNSGKIEVIDQNTLESKATINGLISPRVMTPINDNKAYVSSLYSDSVAIINLGNNTISGYINLRRSSEAIIAFNNKAYISNWMGGKEVMVVNTLNDQVIDSIVVGNEPESMVLDKNRTLWVLCNGGWTRENYAKLVEINTATDKVQNEFVFSSLQASPTCLKIDTYGQTLYYLEKGVKQMDINLGKLPATTLITESNASFYKIAVNPVNSDILITDAVDYTQQGYVFVYKNDGTFIAKEKAGIIPGSMCFRIKLNTKIK
jgi:DNA-binding beta-propeller fold protein YncE